MGVSKVVYGDDTLVDLTGDTVTPTSLTLGATAHAANGEPIVGEYQYVLPPMSETTRGGARIQSDSGLEITDTDNLQVRLALESDGTVRGGIAELTAKGHAEQDGTPTPDNPVPIQVVRGRNLIDPSKLETRYINNDGELNTSSASAAYYSHTEYIAVHGSQSYILSFPAEITASMFMAWYDERKVFISSVWQPENNGVVITSPSNACFVRISIANDFKNAYQLTLGSTPQPYVPYGHVGMEVAFNHGLWSRDAIVDAFLNVTDSYYGEDARGPYIHYAASKVSNVTILDGIFEQGKRYTFVVTVKRTDSAASVGTNLIVKYTNNTAYGIYFPDPASGKIPYTCVLTSAEGRSVSGIYGNWSSGECNIYIDECAVFEGIIDPSDIKTFPASTTPIPLPQRGWGAGLPDGTADSLRLDGAGKCEWTLVDSETTTAATDGITGTVGVDVLSTTGQIADGATVLYKLATPVTEDCGYCEDWPTDIPEGATLSIRELDSVGIKYFIDSSVTELAKQWYARANSEYADRITALEQAVAELATS